MNTCGYSSSNQLLLPLVTFTSYFTTSYEAVAVFGSRCASILQLGKRKCRVCNSKKRWTIDTETVCFVSVSHILTAVNNSHRWMWFGTFSEEQAIRWGLLVCILAHDPQRSLCFDSTTPPRPPAPPTPPQTPVPSAPGEDKIKQTLIRFILYLVSNFKFLITGRVNKIFSVWLWCASWQRKTR